MDVLRSICARPSVGHGDGECAVVAQVAAELVLKLAAPDALSTRAVACAQVQPPQHSTFDWTLIDTAAKTLLLVGQFQGIAPCWSLQAVRKHDCTVRGTIWQEAGMITSMRCTAGPSTPASYQIASATLLQRKSREAEQQKTTCRFAQTKTQERSCGHGGVGGWAHRGGRPSGA